MVEIPFSALPCLTKLLAQRAIMPMCSGLLMPASTETLDKPLTTTDDEPSLDTPWIVTLFDDPVNLMDYVTMVLMRVFGFQRQQAETHMMTVHTKGRSVVWTGERERAELYVQQLHSHQLKATLSRAD